MTNVLDQIQYEANLEFGLLKNLTNSKKKFLLQRKSFFVVKNHIVWKIFFENFFSLGILDLKS